MLCGKLLSRCPHATDQWTQVPAEGLQLEGILRTWKQRSVVIPGRSHAEERGTALLCFYSPVDAVSVVSCRAGCRDPVRLRARGWRHVCALCMQRSTLDAAAECLESVYFRTEKERILPEGL